MILQDYILEIENVIPDNICDEICDNGITDSKSFERALIHDGILAENRKCLVKDINEKAEEKNDEDKKVEEIKGIMIKTIFKMSSI